MSIAPTGQDASKERLSKICRLRYGHREIYGNQHKPLVTLVAKPLALTTRVNTRD